MSDRWMLDVCSLLGLGVSAAAVCDMLLRWNIPWMQLGYTVYAALIFVLIGVILLSRKVNANYQRLCAGKTLLLGLRAAVAGALFLLGWYVNAATNNLYGQDSFESAYNGVRVFAVSATMIGHVFYLAYSHKVRKNGAPKAEGKRL